MTDVVRAQVQSALDAYKSRDRDRVAEIIAELVRSDAPLRSGWGPIARMAQSIGEATSAAAAFRRHAEAAPTELARQLELADCLAGFGRTEEALTVGRRMADVWAGHPAPHHFLGNALGQLGRTEEALASLRRAIALYPAAPDSWLTLASQKRFTADDPELNALRAVAKAHEGDGLERGTLFYALGKALEDIGDVDGAFDAYEQGAALIGAQTPFNEQENLELLAETKAQFDRSFLDKLAPSRIDSDRPIFVVGLPRSGTTLMEQILVAHSAVSDGAEAAVFRHAAMPLSNFRPSSLLALQAEPRWGPGVWTRIGRAYLHLLDERFGPRGRVVDKTLTHTKWIGPIAHILPRARFIWMRRDPGAIAWSCFKTRFAKGIEWSWSLPAMGRHFRFMDAMHAHWTREFGDRLLTIDYEALVADPDTWIPRALAHVGLADEPGTRRFHEVERAVQTASTAQVRRPMYQSSVDGWKAFEAKLAPFFAAYRG